MAVKHILPAGANIYKANLHCHSTYSDGVMTPEELKELYKSKGYSILAYTDHREYHCHEHLADESFLPLAGYELNYNKYDPKGRMIRTCHINAIAVDPKHVCPIEGQSEYGIDIINDAIKRLRDNGFLVNLNHPSWSKQSPDEILQLEGFTAMEIYNSGCTRTYNYSENLLHYDACLKSGKKILTIAADDNHASCNAFSPRYAGAYSESAKLCPSENVSQIPSMDCCYGYMMLYAPKLSYKAAIDSFVSGKYYCSTGPSISAYYIDNDRICIDCTPVRAIFLKTMAWGISSAVLDPGARITHAEFDLQRLRERDEVYFRLELIDESGETAFTNPYYF